MITFKKIASVLSSAAMLTSTVALAAAANYPAPFVVGGTADVALVWGTNAANTDVAGVTTITNSLNSYIIGDSGDGGGSTVEGEAYELFTSSTKLYLNDSINKARTSISSANMPIALKDGTFQGLVTATYTQKVDVGSTTGINNRFSFGQHPTSDDDPTYAFDLGTISGNAIYNLSVSFNKAIQFNHTDSEGEILNLFGQDWTVGAETDGTSIILFKSADKIDLNSLDNPAAEVTVGGKIYTVELISASDTAATIAVTDDTGKRESKEVTEDTSKTINGLEVGVTNADETNLKLSTTVTVGANKVKLTDNTAIKTGSDETTMDGTLVRFGDNGGQRPNNITKIVFQIAAEDTDVDALLEGGEFVDPIFGSLKLTFPKLSIPLDSSDREEIKVSSSGSDKMGVTFKSWDATESKSLDWYYNKTDSLKADGLTVIGRASLADSSGKAINVFERMQINKSEYVVLGNEDTGGIWKLSSITNDTTSATAGSIEFKNLITGGVTTAKTSDWGTGTIDLGTKSYTFDFQDNKNTEGDENVRLRYQDGSKTTANNAVIYPTIQTSEGAKLFFYEPVTIDFSNWDGSGVGTNISALKFPDGDQYTSLAISIHSEDPSGGSAAGNHSWIVGGKALNLSGSDGAAGTLALASVYPNIGQLTYNITRGKNSISVANQNANNTATIYLHDMTSNQTITSPAIVIFEEKDDATSPVYEALIVKIEGAGTTSAKVGVSDVETTWGRDAQFDEIQMKTKTSVYKSADFWGTVITTDQSDTDSYSATISYPDEQVYAEAYIAENAATFSGGSGGGTGGSTNIVVIPDSEIASVASKNLIVVGGSCVNSVAADLLGSAAPLCGSDFTAKTGVGANQFLIETFARSGGKVATLVAGYNAADTTNAVTYLTTQTVMTDVGKKYLGTSATEAQLVTEESDGGTEE